MPYAILRFQKRKAGGVAACERHNERKKEAYKSNPDIDMERSKNNYHLPAVRKILPIFPTAFTGCNTLHFALQSRVPDVPSGLPYGRSYALLSCAVRLRIKEWRHDGDGSCEGVSQNCCHRRHRCHPKGSLPAEERKMMDYALCNPAFPETQSGRRCGL